MRQCENIQRSLVDALDMPFDNGNQPSPDNRSLPTGAGHVTPKNVAISLLLTCLFTLPGSAGGQTLLDSMFSEAYQARLTDVDKSTRLADAVLASAVETGNDTVRLKALFLLGWNAQVKGKYKVSNDYFFKIIEEAPEYYPADRIGNTYGRIGRNFSEMGNYAEAMPYLLKYDSIETSFNSEEVNIEPKLLLGELFEYMLNTERAGEYYREAYELARERGSRFSKIQALFYLLDFHVIRQKQRGFEEEMEEYLELLESRNSDGGLDFTHAHLLFMNMAPQERIALLESRLETSGKDAKVLNRYMYITSLINAYRETGQMQKALALAEREYAFFSEHNNASVLLSLHQYLSELYEQAGNYRQALEHERAFAAIRKSLHSDRIAKYVDSLNILYNTAENEALLAEQEQDLLRQRQQRIVLMITLGAAVWFGAFLVLFFWNRSRLTKRIADRESTLQKQRIHQLEQEKKLLAMSSMIEGQEAERKRIAQDLHDGLGGLLSTVKAQLNIIQQQVSKLESLDLYQRANSLIDDASSELRRITYNMMPSTLTRLGLKEAIEDLAGTLSKDHGLKVDLQILGLHERLGETTEIMLYRIVQELCNNVVKHAEATGILIQLNKTEHEVFLIVEDNGKGFDPDAAMRAKGVGMKSLESRVKFLNGEIDISSSPGNGTCISIHVPLKEAQEYA